MRLLGVTIDNKLCWSRNLDSVITQSAQRSKPTSKQLRMVQLYALVQKIVWPMSGKRGRASPSKSVQSDGLLSTDSVSGSKSPSPPSADHGVPKRRRTDNRNGVEPPPIANSAELLAFEQRLQNYMERQFLALNVQLNIE